MKGKACCWTRLAVGGVWALGLWAVLSAGQARAGCGDHLRPLHADPVRPVPSGPMPPCTGPHCSRAPLVPPAAPAGPIARWLDESATLPPGLRSLTPNPFPLCEPDSSVRPIHRPTDIYHPPR